MSRWLPAVAEGRGKGSRLVENPVAVPDNVGIDDSVYRPWPLARQTADRSGHKLAAGVGGWFASTRYRRRVLGQC